MLTHSLATAGVVALAAGLGTKPWRIYQRELHETIPFLLPRPYYGVRSYFRPEPDYFPR